MIVVCDTNVFVRETHLLRKKGGQTLVRLLRATQGQLLVPEILYREYVEQTLEAAKEERATVDRAFSVLETLIGLRYDRPLPGDESVKQGVVERLRALEPLTLTDPLTPEILALAGTRSLENRRPTLKTDHGFKDCLIWESVLRLPAGSEVRFVSRDKAFFDGDDLAKELAAEAQARGIRAVGYRNIADLVSELQQANPTLDLTALEAVDLAEPASEGADEIASPAAPLPEAAQTTAVQAAVPVATDIQEVAYQLAEAQKRFDTLDLKILAYIAYLGSPSKKELLGTLALNQIPAGIAGNVIERLVITGFVRDTGNHYLLTDVAMGEVIVPTVEEEIIALLAKGA